MFDNCVRFVLVWLLCVMLGVIVETTGGCASRPPLTGDSFPPQIAAQCARAKAAAIRQYGHPPCPYWSVTMKRGEKVGSQWRFKSAGRPVGGITEGSFTTIGCGPNGEINYGDLLHEAGEYATWQDGRMHP